MSFEPAGLVRPLLSKLAYFMAHTENDICPVSQDEGERTWRLEKVAQPQLGERINISSHIDRKTQV